LSQLHLPNHSLILDVGFGHGFLSFETASAVAAHVVGIDFLGGEQVKIAAGGRRIAKLTSQISWVLANAEIMPFRSTQFNAVISFNALQDIVMTGGEQVLTRVLKESLRVLRPGGILGFADNGYPESALKESQSLYEQIQRKEFAASLPSIRVVAKNLQEQGLTNLVELRYDPRISLDEAEAKIELKDIVDARPFGKVFNFRTLWENYERQIVETGLSYPDVFLIMGKRKE
jgi:ubiquinone/menaquinone biosynthesis C-methylase UbiE